MQIELVPTQLWHAASLAPRLRESDLRELRAVTAEHPLAVLTESILITSMPFTFLRDGVPHVIAGAAPFNERVGSAWLLASDDIYKWPKQFMRLSHQLVEINHVEFDVLTNFIDERNVASHRWLTSLGFEWGRRVPHYGIERRPFIQFTSTRIAQCATQ